MNAIAWDHVRRWWWAWAFGLLQVGWSIHSTCLAQSAGFPTIMFPAALCLGAVLLSVDLQRGHWRALLALPVTPRQIGQAWWLATVAWPALALGILAVLIAALGGRPGQSAPWFSVFEIWLDNSLLLGALFFAYTGVPAIGRLASDPKSLGRGMMFSLLLVVLTFGSLYFARLIPSHSPRWILFVAFASLMTMAGWFRAERLVAAHAGPRTLPPIPTIHHAGANRCAVGVGGLRLLAQLLLTRMFWTGALMVMVMIMQARFTSLDRSLLSDNTWLFYLLLATLVMLLVSPVGAHLRAMRALPISARRLSFVLVLAPAISLLAMSPLALALLGQLAPAWQGLASRVWQQGLVLQIGLVTPFVPLIVWRGWDAIAYGALILLSLAGTLLAHWWAGHSSTALGVGLGAGAALGSWWITTRLLNGNPRTYRPRRSAMASHPWNPGF